MRYTYIDVRLCDLWIFLSFALIDVVILVSDPIFFYTTDGIIKERIWKVNVLTSCYFNHFFQVKRIVHRKLYVYNCKPLTPICYFFLIPFLFYLSLFFSSSSLYYLVFFPPLFLSCWFPFLLLWRFILLMSIYCMNILSIIESLRQIAEMYRVTSD